MSGSWWPGVAGFVAGWGFAPDLGWGFAQRDLSLIFISPGGATMPQVPPQPKPATDQRLSGTQAFAGLV